MNVPFAPSEFHSTPLFSLSSFSHIVCAEGAIASSTLTPSVLLLLVCI